MLIAGTPEFMLFCLILMRMSGFVLFNPVLGRRNFPGMFRAGLALVLTLIIYQTENAARTELPDVYSPVTFGMMLLMEYGLGYLLGFVLQLFDFVMTHAGSVIDFQMGFSMATVYDPQSGVQIALTGQVLEIYFFLLFFAVDGHLALMVPYGAVVIGQLQANAAVTLFTECVVLAMKLAFPFIAIEFLVEISIALLTKVIPQINLFVMNIDLKVVVGLLAMLVLISPIGNYLTGMVEEMIREVQEMLRLMGG